MSYKPDLNELEVLEGLKWDTFVLSEPPILFENIYSVRGRVTYQHIPIDFQFRVLISRDFSKFKITALGNATGGNIVDYINEYEEIVKRQVLKHRIKIITGEMDD